MQLLSFYKNYAETNKKRKEGNKFFKLHDPPPHGMQGNTFY